jgi:hypothetical protein
MGESSPSGRGKQSIAPGLSLVSNSGGQKKENPTARAAEFGFKALFMDNGSSLAAVQSPPCRGLVNFRRRPPILSISKLFTMVMSNTGKYFFSFTVRIERQGFLRPR